METGGASLPAVGWGWGLFVQCGVQLVCGAARGEVYEGIHTELFHYIKNSLCENYLNTSVKTGKKNKPQTTLFLGLAI